MKCISLPACTVIFIILSFSSACGQKQLNTVAPSQFYSVYLESFQKLKLLGPVKSIKEFAVMNLNMNSAQNGILLGDTLVRGFWFELNRNKELITVSSMRSRNMPSWKLFFQNKLPKETWRSNSDTSFRLTESYQYSTSGLLETIISNEYGYDEKTRYYYKGNTAVRSETVSLGTKKIREWIQGNDSTFFQTDFRIGKDSVKIYLRSTKFVVVGDKITEIRYQSNGSTSADIFLPSNEQFKRISTLNRQGLIVDEKISYNKGSNPTLHKYKYDNSGRVTYHHQYNILKKEKDIWETVYNENGQSIRFTGTHYVNDEPEFTTLNIYTYDKFGNLTSEDQSGSVHAFQYTYDFYNNWISKKYYISGKLFEIQFRQIEYFRE